MNDWANWAIRNWYWHLSCTFVPIDSSINYKYTIRFMTESIWFSDDFLTYLKPRMKRNTFWAMQWWDNRHIVMIPWHSASSFLLAFVLVFTIKVSIVISTKPQLLYQKSKWVTELNTKTIVQFKLKPSVVVFYAPWCPHCQHFVEPFNILADANKNKGVQVDFGAVNCVEERKMCGDDAQIKGYPTLISFGISRGAMIFHHF